MRLNLQKQSILGMVILLNRHLNMNILKVVSWYNVYILGVELSQSMHPHPVSAMLCFLCGESCCLALLVQHEW